MKFTESQIDALRLEVKHHLSEKRFLHTLGVEECAVKIGEKLAPTAIDKIRVAALLHDISKEYSEAEQISLIKKYDCVMTEEDLAAKPIWHSLTADLAVMEYFPDFADPDILSAVHNHTVGSPDMSLLDEIILLSDYIEDGRMWKQCIEVRNSFFDAFDRAVDYKSALLALHMATVASFNNNINEFVSRGQPFHSRTALTRDAILLKAERLYMENIMDLVNCDSGTLAREAVKVLIEKKGIDVKLFDVREKSNITDYYINVSGRSMSHVSSLADDVDVKLSERGRAPMRTEGKRGNGWILVDFGDVIINVFDKPSREFYNLDKHFSEDSQIDISDLVAEVDKKFEIKNAEE